VGKVGTWRQSNMSFQCSRMDRYDHEPWNGDVISWTTFILAVVVTEVEIAIVVTEILPNN